MTPRPPSRRGCVCPVVGFDWGGLLAVRSDCLIIVVGVASLSNGANGLRPIGRHPVRPVLKHGPRSLTRARVIGFHETHRQNESEGWLSLAEVGSLCPRVGGAPPARLNRRVGEAEQERARWDPKDGELCLSRTKPEETLVEVRRDSDVRIDRQTWV